MPKLQKQLSVEKAGEPDISLRIQQSSSDMIDHPVNLLDRSEDEDLTGLIDDSQEMKNEFKKMSNIVLVSDQDNDEILNDAKWDTDIEKEGLFQFACLKIS